LQRRAFARPVVTEQAENLAASEFERHVLYDVPLAVTAAEIACGQGNKCSHAGLCGCELLYEYNLICELAPKYPD
jgi:hypothetical protein